jgi:thioredoxin-related protein
MKLARLFGLSVGILLLAASAARAGELIIFESSFCEWCEMWHKEVGEIYPLTDEGKLLPLRRVDVDDGIPEDLEKFGHIQYTPTFIALVDNREVGRIIGYPGEESFYGLLGEIVDKIRKSEASPAVSN